MIWSPRLSDPREAPWKMELNSDLFELAPWLDERLPGQHPQLQLQTHFRNWRQMFQGSGWLVASHHDCQEPQGLSQSRPGEGTWAIRLSPYADPHLGPPRLHLRHGIWEASAGVAGIWNPFWVTGSAWKMTRVRKRRKRTGSRRIDRTSQQEYRTPPPRDGRTCMRVRTARPGNFWMSAK